jgi:gamma-glutamyltranspeptidase / glutathione hydrolase
MLLRRHVRAAASLAAVLALSIGCKPGRAPVADAPKVANTATPKPPLPSFPDGWPYEPGMGSVIGVHGMVTTDATLATKVGQEILSSGGNAADAAIAVAFALAVVHPAAGNIGGGGFLVARIGGTATALDFRETAPAKALRDVYVGADGKPAEASREGHRASGVPGSVAGLHAAYVKLGSKKKTWASLVAPAIALAEKGFVVDEGFAKVITGTKERLAKYPASASLYLPDGAAPAVGSTFKNPDLAVALKRIADQGPKGFYEGPTAEALVKEMAAHDGLITQKDLTDYSAKWRTPIELDYRGAHITAMPPPSSGGATLAMICHILDGYDLSKMQWHSADELNLVFEAMRRAFAARNARLGDPDFVKNPLDELLSEAWAKSQRATITKGKATPSSDIKTAASSGDGPHTTHFSVVDEQGNAVALTTTVNWWFGNGVTIPGTGFVMNNEMDDFAAQPGTANAYGLVQGEPNAIAPGKRMLSSMSPTIVTSPKSDGGKVILVLGAAGGPTIITSVFSILSNVVDHGFDVSAAVNAPRFHHQHLPDVVVFEKGGMPDTLQKSLAEMGYAFKERDHIADAPAIGVSDKGWVGAPEVRRPGAFAAGW